MLLLSKHLFILLSKKALKVNFINSNATLHHLPMEKHICIICIGKLQYFHIKKAFKVFWMVFAMTFVQKTDTFPKKCESHLL